MSELITQRYPDAVGRKLWTCTALEWREIDGVPVMVRSNIRWGDFAP